MTAKRFGYVLFPTLIACFFTTVLTATAKFSYRHPYATGERFIVTRNGAVLLHLDPPAGPAAKAVTQDADHDFGLMDPLTMGTHSFVVRNQGDAPLKLQAGPTTCKCTLSEVSHEPIRPGGEGRVTVQWNTGRKNRFYSHQATVYTNDPNQKRIEFSIRGIVRTELRVVPAAAVFERIEPDQPATQRLFVYSQMWDDFEIVDIQPTQVGLRWQIEPADAGVLAAHEALAGCWLRITTPDDLPEGQFSDWLRFRVQPAGESVEPVEQSIAVSGKTLKRLAVYRPGIDAAGIVSMGKVTQAKGAKKRLLLKVRDAQRSLPVTQIKTTPEFLEVQVTADQRSAENGLLQLDITIPPGAPRTDYLAANPARIHLEFDHPRINNLELAVRFAVTD